MILVISLLVVGWLAASVIGTQAYFRGEQSKPIHERNWRSSSFEKLAESITSTEMDYTTRVPGYSIDSYFSRLLPNE
ncbi:MAG: hypothetical protein F6K21_35605 [Symploca sp. SIO2D2]|nr:hypothetical protein [Symploca sp. SIO2D2]